MPLRRALACWAAAALLLAGCGGSDEPRKAPAPQTLTVATGSQGGIYAVWGAAYARAISKSLEGYRGVATRTTGSVENLERLRDGRAQIALTLGDTALDAVEGREAFDRPVALKALAQIYPSYVQVVTRADSDIGTLEDLKGKRVSVGSPDSGTQVVADRVLDVAKVGGFKREQLGVAESAARARAGADRRVLLVRRRADRGGRRPLEAHPGRARRPAPLRARDAQPLGRRLRRRDGPRRRLRARLDG